MRKKVIYFEDEKNTRPVEEFINSLDFKTKTKVFRKLHYYKRSGRN